MKYMHIVLALLISIVAACSTEAENGETTNTNTEPVAQNNEQGQVINIQGDPDNGGLTLPAGFKAVVVADNLGTARHLDVDQDGDIYVNLRSLQSGGSLVALRDTTGDGRADRIEYFENNPGTGLEIKNGYLYFSSDDAVYRYKLGERLVPQGEPEMIAGGFPDQRQHAAKAFTLDDAGNLYVNVGAPSNNCMQQTRTKGSPGMDPCPQLERQAGIWKFSATQQGQQQMANGTRYATGIRNTVALDWNSNANSLYLLQHGRDQLSQFFPNLYTEEENAELPAEEFHKISQGDNIGWPYCYFDQIQNIKVQAPEYGGNGKKVGQCSRYKDPIMAFPGHWAPNDLLFYQGENFPSEYQNGAFIAFHGSWNRAPLEQKGYFVAFVPFTGGATAGDYERFADGFAGTTSLESPGNAEYRPMGLAVGPDGSLYISDSQKGRIWRVFYDGK